MQVSNNKNIATAANKHQYKKVKNWWATCLETVSQVPLILKIFPVENNQGPSLTCNEQINRLVKLILCYTASNQRSKSQAFKRVKHLRAKYARGIRISLL